MIGRADLSAGPLDLQNGKMTAFIFWLVILGFFLDNEIETCCHCFYTAIILKGHSDDLALYFH